MAGTQHKDITASRNAWALTCGIEPLDGSAVQTESTSAKSTATYHSHILHKATARHAHLCCSMEATPQADRHKDCRSGEREYDCGRATRGRQSLGADTAADTPDANEVLAQDAQGTPRA